MAVVLTSEDSSYFSSGSLRRSHSQTQVLGTSMRYSSSTSNLKDTYSSLTKSYSHSAPSSASSSPVTEHAESTDLSYASTPASNFSLPYDYNEEALDLDDEDAITNLEPHSYKNSEDLFFTPPQGPYDNLEPPPSPRTGDSYTPSPADYGSATDTPKPDTPECPEHAEDDTALTTRPSRQVDYLSHEWREEDIWSSWRYIVSRRGEYPNSSRLENASWRTWMKAKNNLSTVSPETLNWLKECDVTWLYGPLQPGPQQKSPTKTEESSTCLSKSGSFIIQKKPILKKRSMSEVMLQRSLSTASLLKQATAAVQAQETKKVLRPSLVRSHTDYVTFPFSRRRLSHEASSSAISTEESSGITSPSTEKKHIHFNEQVEQCIAVEIKGDDDDEMEPEPMEDSDSDSSDGGVVMMRGRSNKNAPQLRKRNKRPSQPDKTIIMLPSTTLKYREDTPEPPETAMKHSRSPVLSPSSSQETLRPSGRSTRFLVGNDDDDEDAIIDSFCDPNAGWRSPPPEPVSGGLHRSASSSSLTDEATGMRRTASGMLMPLEELDSATGDTIFGRVIDTVNTARDIAHVIWNVGWRK